MKNASSYAAMMHAMPAWGRKVFVDYITDTVFGILEPDSAHFGVQEASRRDLAANFDMHRFCCHLWALLIRYLPYNFQEYYFQLFAFFLQPWESMV